MKTTKEMAKIMLAYDRGEHIEKSRYLNPRIWFECKPEWDWHHFDYRVKSKHISVETADEFLAELRKHGIFFVNVGSKIYSLQDGSANYKFFDDGTFCGKEVKV